MDDLEIAGSFICDVADPTVTIFSPEPFVLYEVYLGEELVGSGQAMSSIKSLVIDVDENFLQFGINPVLVFASYGDCTVKMDNTAEIQYYRPVSDLEILDGTTCYGQTGYITINSPEAHVLYEAYIEDQLAGTGIAGEGAKSLKIPIEPLYYEIGVNIVNISATNDYCTIALSEPVILQVNSAPSDILDVKGSTVCIGKEGEVHVLTPEAGITYKAYLDGIFVGQGVGLEGLKSLTITIESSNLYIGNNIVYLTASNQFCIVDLINSANVFVTDCKSEVKEYLSVETHSHQKMNVFPNPASKELNIFCTDSDMSIEIVDVLGNIISTIDCEHIFKNETIQLDISSYSPGLYFVKAETKDGVIAKKIVVQ